MKTWEITHEDGHLISASEGLLQVSWDGDTLTRQSWMVRQEPPSLRLLAPRRTSPRTTPVLIVDALGRLRPLRSGTAVMLFPAGKGPVGSVPARVSGDNGNR